MSTNQNRKPASSERRLSAILFADIVGYTALMQKDEVTARQFLDKFHNTINRKVEAHLGKVINNYGDGCVCTFESSVFAIRCAKEIQQIFQNEPKIPVRIGLHSGDVFFEKDNVYGDSVNIASRIESLGIPGAILFSKQIQGHIANQSEFKIQSLGKFDFKNVEQAMEVFALANEGLAIPKPKQMNGKGKFIKEESASWKRPLLIFALLFSIAGIAFFLSNRNNNFFEEIKDDRVAVLVFKNNTGNPNLDYVGEMTSEWITRALMETKKAKVVNPQSVKQNMKYASVLPIENTADHNTFSKITGAKYFISGSYYLENDELIFSSQINDAISQMVHFSFQEFRGDIQEPSKIIQIIKNKIAGYWLTQDKVLESRFSPPNKDAWLEYQKGRKAWTGNDNNTHKENVTIALKHYKNAVEHDSTFMLPLIEMGMAYTNLRSECATPKVDSIHKILANKKHLMTEYEWNVFQNDKYRFKGNYKVAYEYARKNYLLDPLSLRDNFLFGNVAMNLGKVDEAIATHTKIPFDLISNSTDRKHIIMNLSYAYLTKGQLENTLEIIKFGLAPWHEILIKAFVAIQNKDDNKVLELMKESPKHFRFLKIGWYAEIHERHELARKLYTKGKESATSIENQATYDYHLNNNKQSLINLKSHFSEENIDEIHVHYLLYFFLNYHKIGNSKKASLYLNQLEKFSKDNCDLEVFPTSMNSYLTALAFSGKVEEVENLIQKIKTPSSFFSCGSFYPDFYNAMKDNPVFQDWIKPID